MELRSSDSIQGNILAPFNKPRQAFLFLNFGNDQAAARQCLRRLGDGVATTREVSDNNAGYKAWKRQRRPRPEATSWMGVGLTSWGLVTLHPELAPDLAMHDAFWRGPLGEGTDEHGNRIAPAALVGDREQSDPRSWVVGGPGQPPVDAIVTIAADDAQRLRDRVDQELARWNLPADRVLLQQEGATLEGDHGSVEHFGFRDGVSQPGVRGFNQETLRNGRLEIDDRPGSPIIATGEFVLGYPGERGSYPGGRRPASAGWMRDGSFQVFLRLTQDVAGFLEEMERLSETLGEDVAAKVIGRRKDGTPLASPGGGLNDFDYADDPDGNQTPRFAHVRRANPRNDTVFNDRSHRLLRRGIPFGPLARDQAAARGNPVERGLLLNAFMADIDDQFETVLRNWAGNAGTLPVTPGRGGPEDAVTDGPDPLIGASTHPCLLRRQGQDPVPLPLPRFVRTTGAVYAFAPSVPALRRLGRDEPLRDR
jgi:Dyp-type peroxidase family